MFLDPETGPNGYERCCTLLLLLLVVVVAVLSDFQSTKTFFIGVGAQSTLGGGTKFLPENMYEKSAKCPNFT